MAAEILNAVVEGRICWKDFVSWVLSVDNSVRSSSILENIDCCRGDFALYFLNFIREDASRILQAASNLNNSTKKQVGVDEGKTHSNESSGSNEKKSNQRRIELFPSSNSKAASSTVVGRLESRKENTFLTDILTDGLTVKNSERIVKSRRSEEFQLGNSKRLSLNSTDQTTPTNSRNGPCSSFSSSDISQQTFLDNCALSPISPNTQCDLSGYKQNDGSKNVSEVSFPSNKSNVRSGNNASLGDFVVRDARRNNSSSKKRGNRSWHPSLQPGDSSGNDFPTMSKEPNKSQRRRIKPTRLATNDSAKSLDSNSGAGFGLVSRPVEPSTPFREEPTTPVEGSNTPDFRILLRHERLRQQQQRPTPSALKSGTPSSQHRVIPSPALVNRSEELDKLVDLYCCLMDANLVSNITTELSFVFSLLVVQESESAPKTSSPRIGVVSQTQNHSNNCFVKKAYFKSVHNCVYFATLVFSRQRHVFKILDVSISKMLIENVRISVFVPELHSYLVEILKAKEVDVIRERTFMAKPSSFSGNVLFQLDTDNRENFPTDQAFHIFRKQRDAFYELLQIWEANRLSPGWTFSVALGSRVRGLLNMHNDPANFIHFARLFRLQLLGACRGSGNLKEDEGEDAVLRGLKEGNPVKFSRLHERLVAPLKSSSSSSVLTFPGQQEFFRDFIVLGAHAAFNQHLIDSLAHEILSINATNFAASEVEDSATSVDEDVRQAFLNCLTTARLLAKFLGFVVFLPYRVDGKVPDRVAATQLSIRSQMVSPVDVLACIDGAVRAQKLVLTIPWVVQYLAMLDPVSVNLHYYGRVMERLFAVYRSLPRHMPLLSYALLQLSLGWLFELPHFPEGPYFAWCSNQERNVSVPMQGGSPVSSLDKSPVSLLDTSPIPSLDTLDIVAGRCLSICCPFLGRLKLLLTTDTMASGAGSVRHITPVSAAFAQSAQSSATRQLQLQLEESFLHGQAGSTRKTVEFVIERVASSCVKYVCASVLPQVKGEALARLIGLMKSINNPTEMLSQATNEAQRCACELRSRCQAVVPAYCQKRSAVAFPPLLADDVPENVTKLCLGIVTRTSQEKVMAWVHSHITAGMLTKEFQFEIEKACRNTKTDKTSHVVPSGGRNVEHKEDAPTPPEAMNHIRELIWKVTGGAQKAVTFQLVEAALEIVRETACHRCDVIPSAERVLSSLSVDLALVLVAHRPDLMSRPLLEQFGRLWQLKELATCGPSNCLAHLVCPRNVMLLSRGTGDAWLCFGRLLAFLLAERLLTVKEVESQCLSSLLQQEWPQDVLKNLSYCFQELLQQHKSDEKFVLLMGSLLELCEDMNLGESCRE